MTGYAASACLLLLCITGCHQVTEYRSGDLTRITLVRSSDFQVEGIMEDFEMGRTMFSDGPGGLILVTAEGRLHRIDFASMSEDTSYLIGGSSGDGYGDGVIDLSGDLYVLGPGSQVIEVDLTTDEVVDGFVPGPDPVAICASPNWPRLYFADGTGFIGEIWTSDNHTGFTTNLGATPADIMVEPAGGRYVIAGCTDGGGSLYGIYLDISQYSRKLTIDAGSPCSGILPFGIDSSFAVACPCWTGDHGYVCTCRGYLDTLIVTSREVQGHPVDLSFNPTPGYLGYLHVLSRTDEGNTVISVFEFPLSYTVPELVTTVQLDGFPRDIISPGDGEYIIVLTSDI
ncbi:MAG: hypothetical protein JXA64_05630 [Candidatus Fermentibacteraceae bacterium]|nr:hypothetical protein [Candidatus Fermentibacteraceae bacterium]